MDSVGLSLFDGKVCKKCSVWLPLTKFEVAKSCKDGRRLVCSRCRRPERDAAYWRAYQAKNKEHRNAQKRERCAENPERQRAADKRYYERHKDRKDQGNRAWAAANRDKVRECIRRSIERTKAALGEAYYEKRRQLSKAERLQHPYRHRAHWHNSRIRRKQRTEGRWTAREFELLCEHYGAACLKCGKTESLTADHVVPIAKGGLNEISNLQPLCKSCNCRKHVKDTDYRPDGGAFARSLKQ